jgi:O-antigen/teichoic acid export membrane protein
MRAFSTQQSRLLHGMRSGRDALTKRGELKNGMWGVVDYLSQPTLMLLSAPFLLNRIGPSQYGLWMLASAAVSSGTLLSSGFGDAAVKYVADCRRQNDRDEIIRIVRGMLLINLLLSTVLVIGLWSGVSYAVHHFTRIDPSLQPTCIAALQIGSIIFTLKSIESVFVSTLKGFEQYRPAVRIAIATRIAIAAGAVGVVATGGSVVGIMLATLYASIAGLLCQAVAVRSVVGPMILLPSLHWETLVILSGFGSFSWLQALAGITFSQADKLIIGAMLGAPALAYYSVCTQVAQPVHGLIASGLHFLFPHLSARYSIASIASLRQTIVAAFWGNQALAVVLSVPLMLGSKFILTIWMGAAFAQHAWPVLSIIACSFALLGMNVTGYYTLLATGGVRLATYLNLAAGGAMLLVMGLLIPRFGVVGAATGRLVYGPITWLMYVFVYKKIWGEELGMVGAKSDFAVEGTSG